MERSGERRVRCVVEVMSVELVERVWEDFFVRVDRERSKEKVVE